jgi:RNA polymerase sigma-70 factor (ECF subfamily)
MSVTVSSSAATGFPSLSLTKKKAEGAVVPASGLPSVTETVDEILLSRVVAGDPDALDCLFRRYASLVRGIGRRILRDDGEAEDLVQEVFLFLHGKAGLFDSSRGSSRSWIVQVIYYQAFSRRRHLISRQFYARTDRRENAEPAFAPMARDHQHSGEAIFDRAVVANMLPTLTEPQRETLRLYFFEGLTLDEISAKLNQPLGNVRHHYYRALDRLRKRMLATKSASRSDALVDKGTRLRSKT